MILINFLLFYYSIVFTALPTAINAVFGALILFWEMGRNAQFRIHMMNNSVIIASIFIILTVADIEALSILSSKFAGYRCFSAPMSATTQRYIYWLSFLGLLVGATPQFIIQSFYQHNVTEYDIIPILNLFISACTLAVSLISKVMEFIEPDENDY